ncbi:hypothetical protein BY458DRAFT_523968 [Sporodiniella umbellata]|nr:hypothetical protein BY458DRAFT_523968 [Sporodiniella umbellata]
MPKIKTARGTSSSSKLSPFFRKKKETNPPELHDFISGNSRLDISYPASWADATILSQTDVYRILRSCKLPSSLGEILAKTKDINVQIHEPQHCISVATANSIHLYFYQRKNGNRIFYLPVEKSLGLSTVYLIEIESSLGMLALNKSGRMQYWRQYTDKTFLTYQIPFSQTEHVTAVKVILSLQQVVIGTSISSIYLTQLHHTEEISVFSFYKQTSFIRTLSEVVFGPKSIPSLPNTYNYSLPCRGKVLKIDFIEGYIYVVYTKHIAIWKLHESKIEFLTILHTENYVQQALSSHVPPHFAKNSIQSSLLDICLFSNGVFFTLISYSVPEMGDYVQYAIIELKHNRSALKENASLLILQAVSVPYSVVPDSLKQTPKLYMAYGCPLPVAFITFDRTVVAISLDKEFIFEERVALKEENEILCSKISLINTSTLSATIITKNDIIDFQIDIDGLKDRERNIHTPDSDNIRERDSLVFKSRLQQAVFFGVSEDGPLQFPLRTDQEDITEPVTLLADEIFNGCDLLPKSLDLGLYVESRYVFSNRIMSALADNGLMYLVPESERFKLLKTTEYYHLAIVLYESIDQSLYSVFENAIKSCQNTSGDTDTVRTFLIDHPLQINSILDTVLQNIDSTNLSTDESAQYLKKMQETVLCLAQRAIKYEEKYITIYDIKHHFGDLWMVSSGSKVLTTVFEKMHQCFLLASNGLSDLSVIELKEGICDVSSFLLKYLSIEVEKSNGDVHKSEINKLKKLQNVIIKGLCDCNCFESAIELAERYHNLFSIIMAIQQSHLSEHEKQKKHKKFISIYGYDYFVLIMEWYINNDKEANILVWSQYAPEFLSTFFEHKVTNVSWIYHLLKEDNAKALIDLKEGLNKEQNVYKRCTMLSWAKMLFVADAEDRKSNLLACDSTEVITGLHALRKISIDLEFEAIQTEIVEAFKEHLAKIPLNESPVEFILSKCGRIIVGRNNKEELKNLRMSIHSLLEEKSISKLDVIKLLVLLDNFGPDVENVITALKLTNELDNDSSELFLKIIWTEIYRRDLSNRYITFYEQMTDIQRQNALMETYTYRITKPGTNKAIPPSLFSSLFQSQDIKKLECLVQKAINTN